MSLLPGGSTTYNGKDAMDIILRPALVTGNIEEIFKVITDVKESQQVIFIKPLYYVTIADPGCGSGITNAVAPRSEKYWNVRPMKAWVQQCYADLEGTIYQRDLKSGDERSDLSGTLAEKHMLDLLEPATLSDMLRVALLGDTAIVAGSLTGGAGKVPHYNQQDGLLKKIVAGVGANLIPRVTITENAAAAGAQTVAPAAALAYLESVWYNANPVLKAMDPADKRIYVTRGIMEGYERYLRSVGNIELAYQNLQSGIRSLTFNGVELQVVNSLDQFLAADFTLAGKITNPNWIIYTIKDNFQMGIDTPPGEGLRVFEDETTELYNARLKYKMGIQIALEEYVSVGF